MNPRQRVLAAMRREVPDRVPYGLSFTPPMMQVFWEKTGADNPAEYWHFDARSVGFYGPQAGAGYAADFTQRYYPEGLPPWTTLDEWGVAQVPGSLYHFTKMVHPLRQASTVEEIVDYPLPDYTRAECWQHLEGEVAAFHARDLAVLGALEMTIFEASWYIRGMEGLLSDMLLQPEMAEALLERITRLRGFQAQAYARADVDVLDLGDDVGTQRGMLMSPRMWRQWLKPRLARVIEAARAVKPDTLVWYHSDGDCRAIIPELIEIGVDILNPVQPECMDPAEIKAQYGDRLAFSGTIGTQTTMPFGTPEEVKSVVKERITTVGRGGGLFLAPTHVLEPDVPWENVLAFIEAAEEYGQYP
jgi:uroporphyrinogen decarboxylase